MKIYSQGSLSIGWVSGRFFGKALTTTFVVKGSYALRPGAPAEPLDEPLPVDGNIPNEPAGENEEASLRYESDLAPFKPHADLLLAGTCHAPGGAAVPSCPVTFGVG